MLARGSCPQEAVWGMMEFAQAAAVVYADEAVQTGQAFQRSVGQERRQRVLVDGWQYCQGAWVAAERVEPSYAEAAQMRGCAFPHM